MRIVFLLTFFICSLFAHKLNLFVAQDNEQVIASSYFASGSFCKDCKVEVFNEKNELIEEGKTNKEGEYIIKKPLPKLVVKVEAIGGHAAKMEFEVDNLKAKDEIKKEDSSIFQTLIAIFLLALIFLALKRFKK